MHFILIEFTRNHDMKALVIEGQNFYGNCILQFVSKKK